VRRVAGARRSVKALRLAAVLIAAIAGTASAESPADDLLAVLAAALYPFQVMAYCHRDVAPEPAFRDAGAGWSERNGALLAEIEGRALAAAVPDDARRQADETALTAIAAAVASQADPADYCRLIARIVEAGYYDIDQRQDLQPALKRIFTVE